MPPHPFKGRGDRGTKTERGPVGFSGHQGHKLITTVVLPANIGEMQTTTASEVNFRLKWVPIAAIGSERGHTYENM